MVCAEDVASSFSADRNPGHEPFFNIFKGSREFSRINISDEIHLIRYFSLDSRRSIPASASGGCTAAIGVVNDREIFLPKYGEHLFCMHACMAYE